MSCILKRFKWLCSYEWSFYSDFFKSHKPARVAVEVSKLPKDVVVEIDAIAVACKHEGCSHKEEKRMD